MKSLLRIVFLILFLTVFDNSFSQVGINTTTPLSTLDVNGTLSVKHITLIGTPAITLINDGVYISVDPRATDQEFKLPSPITYPGRVYILRNINDTFTAKLTTVAGNFYFKGSTLVGVTNTIYMYENNNRTMIIVSDGLNWTVFN
jgi:hypothetical protein